MPVKKVYYSEMDGENTVELSAYMNTEGRLFVCVHDLDGNDRNQDFISLNKEDSIDLVTDLAFMLGLIDDNPELEGKMIWKGGSCPT